MAFYLLIRTDLSLTTCAFSIVGYCALRSGWNHFSTLHIKRLVNDLSLLTQMHLMRTRSRASRLVSTDVAQLALLGQQAFYVMLDKAPRTHIFCLFLQPENLLYALIASQ
tara:strand:+ start:793 stop:1122 length:330 start_codon:yes stop_codon:yes gene_type:complete